MSERRGVELADPWSRLAAQILDVAWMLPLGMVLTSLGEWARGGGDLSTGADVMLQIISALLVLLFWATRQATPGKMLMRLRVVDAETGGMPPFPRLVARYLGYVISGLPFGLGYLWMIWDPRRQGWHDKLAQTLVVQDPPRR